MSVNSPTDQPSWYCLRSMSKREHIAAASVAKIAGIQVLCPRIRYKKATRRGKILWTEAMFPGYLFARFNFDEQGREVYYTHGVTGFVRFGDCVPEVSSEVITRIENQLKLDAQEQIIDVEPLIKLGEEVELAGGAFKGQKGEVIELRPAKERVLILAGE